MSGFSIYFSGCMGIFLMVAISIERLFMIHKFSNIAPVTTLTTIVTCVMLSLFWCVMPLLGWSHYSLELTKTSCSVEWVESSFSVYSYNVAMSLFVFFIPLVVLIVTNVWIVLKIQQYSRQPIWFDVYPSRLKHESKIAYKMIINIGKRQQ